MRTTTSPLDIKIQIAKEILRFLRENGGTKAGSLRQVGLLSNKAKPSERDAVLEALRNTSSIESYGGSGRGRSYRITSIGVALLDSYQNLDL